MSVAYDTTEAVRTVRVERLLRETQTTLHQPKTLSVEQWRRQGGPNYDEVWVWRSAQIARFELDPAYLTNALAYYSTHPVEFINHWCDTYDPRNAGTSKPVKMPFVMFHRQEELAQFILGCLRDDENGLVEKSRDMGATWGCVALSAWMWRFWPGVAIGWGSRKQELVDRLGDPDSIFEKIRMLIMAWPAAFLPEGFVEREHLSFMRVVNPANGSTITGEVGDNIGRGGRKRIYFKDESAHYEHPERIEASLGDNTRVAIDISSVNGLGNVFHRKREAGVEWQPGVKLEPGRTRVFVLDRRDHPEKTDAWYKRRRKKAEDDGLLHILAQEVDRNYAASLEGTIIPLEWLTACIDAHKKLGIEEDDEGPWGGGLDIADSSSSSSTQASKRASPSSVGDSNALVLRRGIVLRSAEEWGERDVGVTARRAIASASGLGSVDIQYDASPISSGVKAEANRLKDDGAMPVDIHLVPWMAGGKVLNPQERVVPGDMQSPRNKDFYANLKAQGWWELRMRVYRTWQAITQGVEHDVDTLISFDSRLGLLRKIEKELCQPTASRGTKMKLVVDKAPEGTRSPNLADAIVMAYWPMPRVTGDFVMIGLGAKAFVAGEPL